MRKTKPVTDCRQILFDSTYMRYLLLLPSHFSRVRLCATPWTAAYQASLSMGFSRQEHWSGLPFPSPGDLPDPEIEPGSPSLQADALPSEPPGKSKGFLGFQGTLRGVGDLVFNGDRVPV